jgi:hypothetical protein
MEGTPRKDHSTDDEWLQACNLIFLLDHHILIESVMVLSPIIEPRSFIGCTRPET